MKTANLLEEENNMSLRTPVKKADARPTLAEKASCWLAVVKTYYIKKTVKIVLSYVLYYTGMVWFHDRYFNRNSPLILAYHSIDKRKLRPLEMEQDPENFREQMAYLKQNYTILSLDDFLACKKENRFPQRSVLITFDDGYRDNYTHAFPILAAQGIPAVIFIAPKFIDSAEAYYFDVVRHLVQESAGKTIDLWKIGLGRYHLWNNEMYLAAVIQEITEHFKRVSPTKHSALLQRFLETFRQDITAFGNRKINLSWEEVGKMSRAGIAFGSHSMSHAHLASLSREECMLELSDSKKIIEEKTGLTPLALAYPFGSADAFNGQVEEAAHKQGFAVGFSLANGPVTNHELTVNRIMIDSHATESLRGNFCKPLFAVELVGLLSGRPSPPPTRPRAMNPKINILYLIDNFCAIGGTERHLYYLSMHLNRDRFNPSVAVFDLKVNPLVDEMRKSGIPVHHIPVGREYTCNALCKAMELARLIKKERIDIVQTYHMKSDTYGALVAHFAGIDHLVSSKRDTGDLKKNFHFAAHRLCNRYINNFIFVADSVRREVSRKENIANKRFAVIYNGINAEKFHPPALESAREARKKLGLHEDDFVVGIVAWLRPEKGHAALFDAIKMVKGKIPNIKLIAVGGGYQHDRYRELLRTKGLSDYVRLAGPTDDVMPYLKTFDMACLVPCANEGFSNAILEKMAMGLPLVVTDMGGNAEAVIDGYNGFVVRPNDSNAMADCIVTLFENREKRLEMGRRSRQLIQEKFSLQNMIRQHEMFYESILSSDQGQRPTNC